MEVPWCVGVFQDHNKKGICVSWDNGLSRGGIRTTTVIAVQSGPGWMSRSPASMQWINPNDPQNSMSAAWAWTWHCFYVMRCNAMVVASKSWGKRAFQDNGCSRLFVCVTDKIVRNCLYIWAWMNSPCLFLIKVQRGEEGWNNCSQAGAKSASDRSILRLHLILHLAPGFAPDFSPDFAPGTWLATCICATFGIHCKTQPSGGCPVF